MVEDKLLLLISFLETPILLLVLGCQAVSKTLVKHPGWRLWERSAIGWTRRIKQLGPIWFVC